MTHTIRNLQEGEVPSYYQTYTLKVPQNDFLQVIKDSTITFVQFLEALPEDKWTFRYAPEKWSIKEILLHIIDTERIMAYRALCMSRGDQTPLPGFDQDAYVPYSNADERTVPSLIMEYKAVREASIQLFEYMDDAQIDAVGSASGNPFTPRALGFIIAGHQIHHLQVIKERYI